MPEDRDKVRTVLEDRVKRCPRCGTYPDDGEDLKGGPRPDPTYEAVTHKCYICADIDRTQSGVPKKATGVSVILERVDYDAEDEEDDELVG